MKPEKIMADAEIAACFLRALLDKGVPMVAAVQLTGQYLTAWTFSEAAKDPPLDPWQEPGA